MVTDYARGCLHLMVNISRSEPRLAREHDAIVALPGLMLTVLGDSGTKLTNGGIRR